MTTRRKTSRAPEHVLKLVAITGKLTIVARLRRHVGHAERLRAVSIQAGGSGTVRSTLHIACQSGGDRRLMFDELRDIRSTSTRVEESIN